MKLKKKVIFGMVAGFFAVATAFNMGMLNENGSGDVSLDTIAVMAQATLESGGSSCPTTPDSTCDTFADGSKGCFPVSEPDSGLNSS